MQSHLEVWLHIIAIILVLSFASVHSIYIIMCKGMPVIAKMIAIIILIAIFYLAVNRNVYLPFLGYCAMPPSLFADEKRPANAHDTLVLEFDDDVPCGTRVIYWGAMQSKDKNVIKADPFEAYGNYLNSGIAIVKAKKATIHYLCPDKYRVGGSTVDRHIHYRLVKPNSPIISPVYTKYVKC